MTHSIETLSNQYVAGELDEQRLAELEQLLREDCQAREVFVQVVTVHTDLFVTMRANRLTTNFVDALARSTTDRNVSISENSSARRQLNPWSLAFLALACSLLAMFWLGRPQWFTPSGSKPIANAPLPSEPSAGGPSAATPTPSPDLTARNNATFDAVATLYDSDEAVWEKAVWRKQELALEPGSRLPAGKRLRLKSGLAELAFRSGVEVLIEGPAEIKLVSDMELLLVNGRLTAEVPEDAIGFSVRTEAARIMDLGTVFGVNVDDNQDSEVVVFDGEVIVSPQGQPQLRKRLLTGGGVRASGDGAFEDIAQPSFAPFVRSIDRELLRASGETVANFRRDFNASQPNQEIAQPGWKYFWNGSGPQGSPRHYQPLRWNGSFAYDPNGTGPFPDVDPAFSLHLREFGGHPGRDAKNSRVHDFGHGPVAAFTVPAEGYYAISDSWLARMETQEYDAFDSENEFGLDILIHVNDEAPVLKKTTYGGDNCSFDTTLGDLRAGDTIYIAVGPNLSSRYDTFHWNFSIVRWDQQGSALLDLETQEKAAPKKPNLGAN